MINFSFSLKNSKIYYLTTKFNFLLLFITIFFILGLKNDSIAEEVCSSIKITAHPNSPPYSWINIDGELTGSSIEFSKQLSTEIGINKFDVVAFPSELLAVENTANGNIDLIAAVSYTFNGSLQFQHIKPSYYRNFAAVVVRKKESFNILSYDDLIKRVGTSGQGVSYGQSKFGMLVGSEIATVKSKSIKESFDMLVSKKVDYNLLYKNTAESWITEYDLWNKFEILPVYAGSNDFYMAWSKLSKCLNSDLIKKLSLALKKAVDNNIPDKLQREYNDIYLEDLLKKRAKLK